MTTFRNIHWKERNYDYINRVACVAKTAPDSNWSPCSAKILDGLEFVGGEGLCENAVDFYGYL